MYARLDIHLFDKTLTRDDTTWLIDTYFPDSKGFLLCVIFNSDQREENQTGVYLLNPGVIPDFNTVAVHPSDDIEPDTRQQPPPGRFYVIDLVI